MKAEKKSSGAGRTRNFATVVYPESAPDGWQDALAGLFVPAFVSPLHDKDINPDGQPKKPHYHVMLMFEGVKTLDQAREAVTAFGGVGCEKIQSIRGYARYLCHLDNPDKAQYNQGDVRTFAGADYIGTIGLVLDKYKAIGEMIDYCIEHEIYSYSKLMQYARAERFDWFRCLCDSGTYPVKEFLKSYSWDSKQDDFNRLADDFMRSK